MKNRTIPVDHVIALHDNLIAEVICEEENFLYDTLTGYANPLEHTQVIVSTAAQWYALKKVKNAILRSLKNPADTQESETRIL